jgi:hypothetical protein
MYGKSPSSPSLASPMPLNAKFARQTCYDAGIGQRVVQMFHEACHATHAKLIHGKCPWCGQLIVEGKPPRHAAREPHFLTLEQLVNSTRELTPNEAATLLGQIAEAVAAHADTGRLALYPAAICLTDHGKVQLRSIYRLAVDEPVETSAVDYLAPEQALDSHKADSRAASTALAASCTSY